MNIYETRIRRCKVATALVEAFISNLEGKGDLEKAAATIAQGIKDYSTDKRGR